MTEHVYDPPVLVNMIKCPDGTVLQSVYGHDFVMHNQEDGRSYNVDGGLHSLDRGFSDEEYEELSLFVGDPHEKVREHFTWISVLDEGGYQLQEPKFIKLKDITDNHLEALVEFTKEDYPPYINDLFVTETEYRN